MEKNKSNEQCIEFLNTQLMPKEERDLIISNLNNDTVKQSIVIAMQLGDKTAETMAYIAQVLALILKILKKKE